jgi:hypothetical protein
VIKKYKKWIEYRYPSNENRYINNSIRGPVLTLFSVCQLKEEKAARGIYNSLVEYSHIVKALKLMEEWYENDKAARAMI